MNVSPDSGTEAKSAAALSRQRGSTLLYAIGVLTVLAALTAGVASFVPVSYISEVSLDASNRARFLAEAGLNYARGLNWKYENDASKLLNNIITDLNAGSPYTLPNNAGTFSLSASIINATTGDFQVVSTGTVGSGTQQTSYQRTVSTFNFTSVASNTPNVTFTVSGSVGGSPSLTWTGATGSVQGTVTVVSGPGVLGLNFNTNCEAIKVNYTSSLAWTPSGTIMFWVNMSSFSNNAGLMHKGVSTHSNDPYGIFDDEVWSVQFGSGSNKDNISFWLIKSNTQYSRVTASTSLSANTWYHVACTWQPSGMAIYINGALNASTTDYVVPRNNTSDITFGAQSYSGSCYTINGSMADIQIWNRVLPLTDANTSNASIQRSYCHGKNALGSAPAYCTAYPTTPYP